MNPPTAQSDHRETTRSIWVFTPSRTAAEDLEAILVQRHDLLKDAVERVRESALTDHKHHLLFVGPRGCGKTHLVTLIVSRISADDEASKHLRLAWLNEDETCTSLLELLIKVHSALEKRHPDEFPDQDLAGAYELKPAGALDFVAQRLLASLGSKTLVVVTENLDALFESMGEEGQQQLRAFIQEHPQFAIVATAQRLVEDLSDRASPFFGFFQTEHLKPLSVEQATTLLQNIARLQGKTDVTEFLTTNRGRSRVRALHHLSGGNHRIYIVLSQFITLESMDSLIGPFMKMVDELTPYYQERVRWLPPMQRKIVEMLCTCENTVPVKEIARRLFATPQTISSQLQDLREKGYVESSQRGRESLYEISEPLMRICVEVKENQNKQPLRLLVDFLRVWYDDVELDRRLGLCQPESASHRYLAAALERNATEGNLRIKMLVHDIFGDEFGEVDSEGWKRLEACMPEEFFLAVHCQRNGDLEGALRCTGEALASATDVQAKCLILCLQACLHSLKGDSVAGIADYTRAIDLPGAPPDLIALALVNRGDTHGELGDSAEAIADHTRAIDLPSAPPYLVAMALFTRGFNYGEQGDRTAAITDYSRVIDLPEAPPKTVVEALFHRGLSHSQHGDIAAAIADYSHVIKLPGALPNQVAAALFNRGFWYGRNGDIAAEMTDYTSVIELLGAPPELVARALISRGVTHLQQGDSAAAIADYSHAIELTGAPPELVAKAIRVRKLTHSLISQTRLLESKKDVYRERLEELVSIASLPAKNAIDTHLDLAELHFSDGRWSEGFSAIETGLILGAQQSPAHFGTPMDIIRVLFSAGLSQEGRRTHAGTLYAYYARHGGLAVLGEALVKHLGDFFAKGAPWPASDNLDQWLVAWKHAAGDAPEFKLPLRLLRTGIEFIQSGGKDRGILLNLTATERSILKQALGIETTED